MALGRAVTHPLQRRLSGVLVSRQPSTRVAPRGSPARGPSCSGSPDGNGGWPYVDAVQLVFMGLPRARTRLLPTGIRLGRDPHLLPSLGQPNVHFHFISI